MGKNHPMVECENERLETGQISAPLMNPLVASWGGDLPDVSLKPLGFSNFITLYNPTLVFTVRMSEYHQSRQFCKSASIASRCHRATAYRHESTRIGRLIDPPSARVSYPSSVLSPQKKLFHPWLSRWLAA